MLACMGHSGGGAGMLPVGVGVGVGVGVNMGVFMGAGSRPLRREFNKPKASPGVGGQMDGAGKVRIRRNAMT